VFDKIIGYTLGASGIETATIYKARFNAYAIDFNRSHERVFRTFDLVTNIEYTGANVEIV